MSPQHSIDGPGRAVERQTVDQAGEALVMRQGLDALGTEIDAPVIENVLHISEDPNLTHNRVNEVYSVEVPMRFNAIAQAYPMLGDRTWIAALNGQDSYKDVLNDAMDAILTPVDPADAATKHRYLTAQKQRDQSIWFRLNKKTLDADMQALLRLKATNPEHAAQLSTVESALRDCMLQHPDLPVEAWGSLVHQNEGTKTVYGMLRLPAILVLGAATIFTGISAIANKKKLTAPLFYAALTGLLAAPDLRRSIFGGKHEKTFKQMDMTVNNAQFKDMLRTFDIHGPAWAALADEVMTSKAETQTFLRTLDRTKNVKPEEYEEAVREYVTGAMHNDADRAKLDAMIRDGTFKNFANRLMEATDRDTQDVIRTYILQGTQRFEQTSNREAGAFMAETMPNDSALAYEDLAGMAAEA